VFISAYQRAVTFAYRVVHATVNSLSRTEAMRLLQTLAAFGGRHAKEWLTTINNNNASTGSVSAIAAAGHDAVSAAVATLQVRVSLL
jgi:ABC-type Fe3+ transport system substrate-binding protein